MSVGTESSVRECRQCGEIKQLVAFNTYRNQDGSSRRFGICKRCREEKAQASNDRLQGWRKEYYASTRSKRSLAAAARRDVARKFVNEYKSSRTCADCGKNWPPVAMDLDHVRGSKIRCVAGMVSAAYKTELIAAELEKCDVVCACCHRLRTAARGQNLGGGGFARKEDGPKPESIDRSKMIEHNGETRSILGWSKHLGLNPKTVSIRLIRGHTVEFALSTTKHKYTKLSEVAVKQIRADISSGMSQRKIASRHNVSQATIGSIFRGRTWKTEPGSK